MKYCQYCNMPNEDDTINCTFCGSHLFLNENSKQEEKVEETPKEPTSEELFYLDHITNKKRYILTITLYFVCFYGISIIAQLLYTSFWLAGNGVSIDELYENTDLYNKYEVDTLGFTNLITYIITSVIIVLLLFKNIKNDLKVFISKPKFYLKWTLYGIGIMYLGVIIASIIVTVLTFGLGGTGTSENQDMIDRIFRSGGFNAISMAIVTVLLAPVLEELIFRKSLFGLFKKNTLVTVIVASIIFASIHIVPACISILFSIPSGEKTGIDLYLEFIYIFSYLGQAFAISFVYHKTKANIIPSIIVHFTNNFIAIIAQILLTSYFIR